MKTKRLTIRPVASIVLVGILTCFYLPSLVRAAQIVNTDKDIYNQGEMVKVNFSSSPGHDGDWICIVPVGSPDTEAGDFKYMPKGLSQGSLIFDPPRPGKYEVRAYYNYSRKGYVVSGRHAFSVVSSPEGKAAMAQRMERKIDPSNPVEANIPVDYGLVYIFRESLFASGSYDVQILANEKPIVFMRNSSYFLSQVPAGDVNFASGSIRDNSSSSASEFGSLRECTATIKVKPGHVYYLRLKMIPIPFWTLFLDHVPHQEGANIIESYKLSQLKK
jgi:hypothetical protein